MSLNSILCLEIDKSDWYKKKKKRGDPSLFPFVALILIHSPGPYSINNSPKPDDIPLHIHSFLGDCFLPMK